MLNFAKKSNMTKICREEGICSPSLRLLRAWYSIVLHTFRCRLELTKFLYSKQLHWKRVISSFYIIDLKYLKGIKRLRHQFMSFFNECFIILIHFLFALYQCPFYVRNAKKYLHSDLLRRILAALYATIWVLHPNLSRIPVNCNKSIL